MGVQTGISLLSPFSLPRVTTALLSVHGVSGRDRLSFFATEPAFGHRVPLSATPLFGPIEEERGQTGVKPLRFYLWVLGRGAAINGCLAP